ncbi:hypothetical protein AQS8620_01792 [Aquimixticola soesokkakensis]|uniref:Bacterial SH3 domain protein n=1 Tax=Aquimixticola soesokkakensis TaxID=1519096 RepID=A0A1Y5SQ24_9RHOB|nr:DUF1236 domain-containing protein [Aquimixticola soesokkakensis]SLN44505.1 hypothetical protein AQS8620_01792 [Aquimixticola soesokkakensis]
MLRKIALLAAGTALVAGPALALTATTSAGTDIYAAPMMDAQVRADVQADSNVELLGCLEDATWCTVAQNGTVGWMPTDDLNVMVEDEAYALAAVPSTVTINTLTYTEGSDLEQGLAAAGGIAAGATAGVVAGGPVGGVVGGFLGAVIGGEVAEPEEKTITYIKENPLDPVYLYGSLETGVTLPETVTLTPVPDTEYSYVYVNGEATLVNTADRSVVYIAS